MLLLYSTLHYATILYSILPYAARITLLYSTLLYGKHRRHRFTLPMSTSFQEKEACLKREQDDLSRAKDRWQRERSKAADDNNQDLRTALRRAEAAR